jgi:uncharacterized BrkB/YihY/UPF0761 family membrane protein
MNPIEAGIRRVDAFQQRHLAPGFVFAIIKKYGDDDAGALVVQLTYAMFTTVFPLLLLLVTILSIFLAGDPSARRAVLSSTFSQFPIVGHQMQANIHVMRRNSTFGLVVGILGLLYGTTGLSGSGLYAMEQVWNIRGAIRPNYVTRMGRSLVFLALLAVGLVITTGLSSFGTFGSHDFWLGIAAEVLAAAVNVGLYLAAFRVLTPKPVPTSRLVPGVILAGIVWTVLQALGGYVVGHYLRDDNPTYGMFGTVLGLITWIYFGAQVTMYSAELNVVVARRMWPRGMVQPPLTKADQESIAFQATENQRRPEQEVLTRVRGRPMTQDEYREAGYEADTSVVETVHRVSGGRELGSQDADEPPEATAAGVDAGAGAQTEER